MAILLTILLWLLGIVGAVLLLVVFMPLHLRAAGAVEPWQAEGMVDARWAFGLLGVRATYQKGIWFRMFGLNLVRMKPDDDETKAKKKTKKKAKREQKKAKKKETGRKRGLRWGYDNMPLFRRLVRALHVRGWLRGTVGLDDPADTAQLEILLRPLMVNRPGFHTRIDWSYIDEALALEGALQARVWPAELVWILLATFARSDSRRSLLASN